MPSKRWFRISSWLLRVAVWRRLGLPVETGGGEGTRLSKHGKAYDRLGDMAQSDGHAGHAERHTSALAAYAEALRGAFGTSRVVTPDTDRHAGWEEVSPDYRPDLDLRDFGPGGERQLGDVKVFSPIASDGDAGADGAVAGFANTAPRARETVRGRLQRGEPTDAPFDRLTGRGYVSAKAADYAYALAAGLKVWVLGFEVFGGFGAETLELLSLAARHRNNKLSHAEYDLTSWSARSWYAYQIQRISIRLTKAVAWELASELGCAERREGVPAPGQMPGPALID